LGAEADDFIDWTEPQTPDAMAAEDMAQSSISATALLMLWPTSSKPPLLFKGDDFAQTDVAVTHY
jgi:hypothetical protein